MKAVPIEVGDIARLVVDGKIDTILREDQTFFLQKE